VSIEAPPSRSRVQRSQARIGRRRSTERIALYAR